MSKTSTIINHLTGMDSDTIAVVGTTGQVQLIKHETDMEDINEFYDQNQLELAQAISNNWDTE